MTNNNTTKKTKIIYGGVGLKNVEMVKIRCVVDNFTYASQDKSVYLKFDEKEQYAELALDDFIQLYNRHRGAFSKLWLVCETPEVLEAYPQLAEWAGQYDLYNNFFSGKWYKKPVKDIIASLDKMAKVKRSYILMTIAEAIKDKNLTDVNTIDTLSNHLNFNLYDYVQTGDQVTMQKSEEKVRPQDIMW